MQPDFIHVDGRHQHVERYKEILAKHPEVRSLMGKNPATAIWVVSLVGAQWTISSFVSGLPWYLILLLAYCLGAFINHALYVLIHECTHDLVFEKSRNNSLLGIVCDFALVIPSAMGFRKYHLMHHRHLGEYLLDPDIVRHEEARLVGNKPVGKALWLFFFSVSQALRPMQVTSVSFWDRWIVTNLIAIICVDIFLLAALGPHAVSYLLFSTLFALGLHPVGGRWIQEHYVTELDQETYSYYGPLNNTCFNMGYHNEHHDFSSVPWNNLPKIKAQAPEYYDSLKSYRSWTAVLINYIFNPEMSSYSRIVHPATGSTADTN
jgi:sphingolipid delta-4 desaturase